MCRLCYVIGERPRVIAACETCHGLAMLWDGSDCPTCHGRAFTSHQVSFECPCDGCRDFRGEAVPAGRVSREPPPPEIEAAFFLLPPDYQPNQPTLPAG